MADWYDSDSYAASRSENPTGSASGFGRLLRGGSWNYDVILARAANRAQAYMDSRDDIGFRCVRSP